MSLTARAAARVSDRRMEPSVQSLEAILKAVDTHIATAATIGARDCIAPIPFFIPGASQFNIDQTLLQAKLVDHYTCKGFHVRDLGPFKLYVSWRHPRKPCTTASVRATRG